MRKNTIALVLLMCACRFDSLQSEDVNKLYKNGINYERSGNDQKALEYYQKIQNVLEKQIPKDYGSIQENLYYISTSYARMAKIDEAIDAINKSLDISKRIYGKNSWQQLHDYNKLISLYRQKKDFTNAKKYNFILLDLSKRIQKDYTEFIFVQGAYCSLADTYYAMGEKERAQEIYKFIIPDYERNFHKKLKKSNKSQDDELDIHDYATVLDHLGNTYLDNNPKEAIKYLEKSLEINKNVKCLNEFSAKYDTLQGLAEAHLNLQDYATAKKIYESIYDYSLHIYGENHVQIAQPLYNLGRLSRLIGDYKQALSYDNKILNISQKYNINLGFDEIYKSLSYDYYLNKDIESASRYNNKYICEIDNELNNIFSLSESERLSWAKNNIDYFLPLTLCNDDVRSKTVANWKGAIIDSILNDNIVNRRSKNGAIANENKKRMINEIQSEIAKVKIVGDEASKQKVTDLNLQIDKLQSSLSSSKDIGKINLYNIDIIKKSLASTDAIIDFVLFKNTYEKSEVYGISIITKNHPAFFLNINEATAINHIICEYRHAIITGNELQINNCNAVLFDKIWRPISKKLPPESINLYIGADGPLNFISLASLLDQDGKFLSEKYQIAYIGSARDLLRPTKQSDKKDVVIYANPNFSSPEESKSCRLDADTALNNRAMRPSELAEFSKVQLPELPGTEQEAITVAQIAKGAQWTNSTHLGYEASKSGLMAMKAPGVLHLATHGFFLGGEDGGGEGNRGMKLVAAPEAQNAGGLQNSKPLTISPMRQSGVALTGGQSTLQAWGRGEFPDPSNDGILTAEEVAGLDLDGTWLVTLSACETGLGQVQSGEGVFGLRRAFMIAGAQNLLMTLWPVSDEVTPKIMADFYKEAFATHDAAGSLARVQREWLVKLRKEKGLMAAVRDVGPFAMVVMANPNARPPSQSNPEESPTPAAEATPRPVVAPGVSDSQSPPVASSIPEQKEQNKSQDIIPSATTASTPGVQSGDRRVLEFNEALAKADAGDAYAQGVASIYYGLGYKTPKDVARAASYALKSAAQGNPLGIYRVGAMRSEGEGMQKNSDQGRTLKRKAFDGLNAMTGDPYALNILGIMAYSGEVIPQDTTEALRLYKQSADFGYAPAQYNYARLILNGGVAGDAEEANAYKEKAAAQNYP